MIAHFMLDGNIYIFAKICNDPGRHISPSRSILCSIEGLDVADTIIAFGGSSKQVGLIVRGKQSPDHHPDNLAQHADAILSDGSPIGFYGQGNDQSGNAIGLRMQGVVYDYADMKIARPWYVNVDSAVAN